MSRLGSLPLIVAGLVAAGCSSPTQPLADPIAFSGQLAFEGEQVHSLTLESAGVVQIRVAELRAQLVDVTDSVPVLTIGLGLGRPTEDGCATSFTGAASEGSVFPFGLAGDQEFCVRLFDSGRLREDAVVAYTITVTPAG